MTWAIVGVWALASTIAAAIMFGIAALIRKGDGDVG